MNLKFLYPLIGLVLGIFLSSECINPIHLAIVSSGLALGIWAVLTFLSKNPLRSIRIKSFHSLWILFLFMAIGAFDFYFRSYPMVNSDINNRKCFVSGIIEDVKYLSDGDRFNVQILSISDSTGLNIPCRNVNMLLKTDGYVGSKGDIISFKCVPKAIQSFSKSSDYSKRLIHKGIRYFSNVKFENISKTGESNSLLFRFNRLREDLIILIEKSSINRETGDFLISIILGDKSFLSNDTRQLINSAGMAHVLALSGMHVAIILSIILCLLFPLSFFGFNKTRKILAISLIWLYVLFTGGAPSTVRAAIMATFVMTAFILERKNSALNALLAAALFILFFNPLALWDVGLQLSCLCVAAIILFVSKLNPVDHHLHPLSYKITSTILITLITTLSTWVLIAYYFGKIPLLFLPSNLLLLPLLPFFVALGMVYIITLAFGYDIVFIGDLLSKFHRAFIHSADILSLSGGSAFDLNISLFTVIAWLAGILIFAIAVYSNKKIVRKISISVASLFLFFSIIYSFFLKDDDLSVQSVKFAHNFSKIEVIHSISSKTHKIELPRRNISHASSGDIKILSIDMKINPDSIQKIKQQDFKTNNFLFVSSGADFCQIAELINENDFQGIILHAGVGPKKKTELLRLINEDKFDKIYSLRETGSLEFFL